MNHQKNSLHMRLLQSRNSSVVACCRRRTIRRWTTSAANWIPRWSMHCERRARSGCRFHQSTVRYGTRFTRILSRHTLTRRRSYKLLFLYCLVPYRTAYCYKLPYESHVRWRVQADTAWTRRSWRALANRSSRTTRHSARCWAFITYGYETYVLILKDSTVQYTFSCTFAVQPNYVVSYF